MSRPMSRPPVPPGSPRRLGALSTAQLRALLQDEPRLQRAARLSRKFQSLQLEREMCLASNCTQAKVNLSLRPQLEDGKAALAIKYQELQEIREACRDKQQRLEAYLENWSPQSALGKLQAKLDASEAESEAQVEQFLAQDLPLDSFLESFCQSRTRSHICRTQLEKLQELLQKDRVGRDPAGPTGCRGALPSLAPARLAPLQNGVVPKAFNLSCGFVPTFLIPSEAVVPFAVPTAPPRHHLPALGHQPASPCSKIPSLGSPLHLVGHIPLLSPRPSCRQQEQKQELPHR
ncbi:vacuolar protein sorting-associated protein 37D isoform X3 [Neopsephotus bourkii]|uniref:vacuolar protein sorting-associated protein 37D isoform X3 n=1 Tax=Neopsephotus bourkii TaxID=309878 RepID=UPI002AA55CDA|nr:vacuolar protein sorting-associated protein 37D isoform X3 [Neopsephotus bourkii]